MSEENNDLWSVELSVNGSLGSVQPLLDYLKQYLNDSNEEPIIKNFKLSKI